MIHVDKEIILNWAPRYIMAYSNSRWLYFKPNFSTSTISYVVRKEITKLNTVEHEFDDLDEAIDYYNVF